MTRLIGAITLLASLVAIAGTIRAAKALNTDGSQSWLELLGIPLLCFSLSTLAAASTILDNPSWRSTVILRMTCYFMARFILVYLPFTALADTDNFKDGVTYWAGVTLPCFWIGGTLAIIGTLVGLYRAYGPRRRKS